MYLTKLCFPLAFRIAFCMEDDDDYIGNTIVHATRARATKMLVADVRQIAASYRVEAIETLLDVMNTGKCSSRVAAAMGLLAYSDGKPTESITMGKASESTQIDMSRLSGDELATVARLMSKARGES